MDNEPRKYDRPKTGIERRLKICECGSRRIAEYNNLQESCVWGHCLKCNKQAPLNFFRKTFSDIREKPDSAKLLTEFLEEQGLI